MITHLEHTRLFLSTFTTYARSLLLGKMSADGILARGRTIILIDSARKRNRKKVMANYNKPRINIGHQHDR
jgi:hypothetical protein